MRIVVLLSLLLAGCVTGAPEPLACPAGTGPATVVELLFGRNAGGVLRVSDADWAAFLAEEATPRFPDGLTVMDAQGQWRGRDGRIEREAAKVMWLVLPGVDAVGAASRVEPLAAAYRVRFAQESVLRAVRPGCVGF